MSTRRTAPPLYTPQAVTTAGPQRTRTLEPTVFKRDYPEKKKLCSALIAPELAYLARLFQPASPAISRRDEIFDTRSSCRDTNTGIRIQVAPFSIFVEDSPIHAIASKICDPSLGN
jgi:hypothetical protein